MAEIWFSVTTLSTTSSMMSEEQSNHYRPSQGAASSQAAVERFCDGCNCSQAVLTTYAKRYALDEGLAMRIASGLGGGVGRMGDVCGTLTGAALVLGLELGPERMEESDAKEATYVATRQLQERFIERHGSSRCRELLEKDLSVPEEYRQAKALDLFKTRCPLYVETAVILLDELLNEKKINMKQKILTMLELQDAMNRKVNDDWRDAGYPWYRAIWTECAEMLDHYGWKWWKHQKPDMQQVHLEIVDIWHFALSDLILHNTTLEEAAELAMKGLGEPSEAVDFRTSIEQLAMASIQTQSADISHFAAVMQAAELGFDELFKTYVGKNVLNFFRQDHGYKEGSYIKLWNGREDNEHLADILANLDASSSGFSDEVYRQLEQAYPAE
ncbi:C-GCAxxG-C-C family (seleno)protein [Candidatus Thiodiazotropha sp. CDECU1]|uniref:C-GCAxxG-C-C family (seleno)protein n=1 Tax=Candidatus Thiodiazotropha sp. CDECU1 TaxID=3065865 RepID=UPI002930F791|nr:C-GCAxxG-C-C family (seleno)protein [Candidatus Thiodiazotropha sp. CDECU1]